MNDDEVRSAVHAAIARIAPDVGTDELGDSARLRHDLGLDSMDLLTLVQSLDRTTGVDIPERDYGEISTVGDLVAYIVAHA